MFTTLAKDRVGPELCRAEVVVATDGYGWKSYFFVIAAKTPVSGSSSISIKPWMRARDCLAFVGRIRITTQFYCPKFIKPGEKDTQGLGAGIPAPAITTRALFLGMLLLFAQTSRAAVLPDERGDILYHSYDGGGVTIDGPSLLVRKNVGDSTSVGYNHYIDNVTSASIDVVVSASEYTEKRTENSVSVDYLNQKSIMSLSYTNSVESDFDANTVSLGVSQDMFGDLTNLSLGFSYGDNSIGQNGNSSFSEAAEVRSYRASLSQIFTKDLIVVFAFENITDQGYLNNPYRSVRYCDTPVCTAYSFQSEVYPESRTSNAFAVRANYFLEHRAALHTGVRFFSDNWGINSTTLELGYTVPVEDDWIFELRFRYYDQTSAEFFSDLFSRVDEQNFLARDKEMSAFDSFTLGVGASHELDNSAWQSIKRASLNFNLDYLYFDYHQFRDLTAPGSPGNEPLYSFDAMVIRAFASIWF